MSSFQPGDLIGGRYRLLRIIGAGAMGTVWSARNESTDRDFALKLMLPDAAKNPVALQRFFQEAKASGRLRHRSIVEVYDLGRMEGSGAPYLVMELLEGEPLDSVLRRGKTLPIGTSIRLVRDVARALEVAHQQRIVHRDLKPANIYLHKTLDGVIVPKILDFGISKLVGPTNFDPVATSAGTVLGSPAYMSPEQAAGETDVDGRSDVWSLGVILFKALAGTVPFQAPNYNALMKAITMNAHPPLAERVEGLPPEVDAAVDKCLAKERSMRFDTAKSLADALEAILVAHPALPTVDLLDLVSTAVELNADDARTIATLAIEGSQAGTLVATELPKSGPSSSSAPERRASVSATQPRDEGVAAFRPKISKQVRIGAGVAAVSFLLSFAVFASRGTQTPAPVETEKTSLATTPPPKTDEPFIIAPPTPAPVVAAAPPPSASVSTDSKHVAKHVPAVTKSSVVKAKTAATATAKPAHEGVTSTGF